MRQEKKNNQREISRKFHINRDNLLLLLSYLEIKKIIIWDKKNKKVSLDPDWIFWRNRFQKNVDLILDGIKKMPPYSIRDAKEIFDIQTEYTLELYEK